MASTPTSTIRNSSDEASQQQQHVYIYSEALIERPVPRNVTHVNVLSSMIHDHAFYDCSSLVQVLMSSPLQSTGPGSFNFCTNLRHVQFPASLKTIDMDTFTGCTSLDNVQLPEGLEVIDNNAFFDCESLRYMSNLPSTLKRIGDGAFASCKSLVTIEFPSGLREVGEEAFVDSDRLERVLISSPSTVLGPGAFTRCRSLRTVELPDGLRVIGRNWFSECTSMQTLDIPASVMSIEDEAFTMCEGLVSLDLPTGLASIGNEAFAYCTSLATIQIPSTVRTMGMALFSGCENLHSVSLPPSLNVIEGRMFADCVSLRHVRIPPRVTKIGESAFQNCFRLISLELPEGLQSFDSPHLSSCRSLVNVALPSTLQLAATPNPTDVLPTDVDDFVTKLKMGSVVSDFIKLVDTLQHRFDDLPLHKICYYHSYDFTNETRAKMGETMEKADPNSGVEEVDFFGMTPFHLLALSQKPSMSALQELLTVSGDINILRMHDKFGSTPIDYLCLNPAPEASAMLKSWLPLLVTSRLKWVGLERWKSEVVTAMESVLTAGWPSRSAELGTMCFKLATVERFESISLLEMALWQARMEESMGDKELPHKGESITLKRPRLIMGIDRDHRHNGRINSGANVVIPNVLPFLGKVLMEDFGNSSEAE